MFRNYLTTAWRNLVRYPSQAIINIVGLSLAIGWNLLAQQFVTYELTFDRFHEHVDRIYRVVREDEAGRNPQIMDLDVGIKLVEDYPGFESFVRTRGTRLFLKTGDDLLEEDVLFADPSLLEVFTFPLLAGDEESALRNVDEALLSSEAALRRFGTLDVVGRQIAVATEDWQKGSGGFYRPTYDQEHVFTVAGVLDRIPGNSSLVFDVLLPYEATAGMDIWGFPHLFALLEEGVDAGDLPSGFPRFVEGEMGADPASQRLLLQPYAEIHFDASTAGLVLARTGRPVFLSILSAIGVLILAVACINYGNLSIARFATRAREIGVRKAVGARRSQLAAQFWGEAMATSALGLGLGLILARSGLPVLNQIVGGDLNLEFDYLSPGFIVGLLSVTAVTGLLAGVVPALVLSNLRTSAILASRHSLGAKSTFSRGLVVAQLALSVFLAIGAVLVTRQVDFMRQKDLGFDDDQVVTIHLDHDRPEQVVGLLRSELLTHPEIIDVSAAGVAPGGLNSAYLEWAPPGRVESVKVARYWVDPRFVRTMGMQVVAGSDFREEQSSESDGVLVNETLAAMLGAGDVTGHPVPGLGRREGRAAIVQGVVRDFHNHSLHHKIGPAIIYPELTENAYALARLSAHGIPGGMRIIRDTWERLAPGVRLKCQFFDQHFARWDKREERLGRMVRIGSCLAVLIGCLGLYGLAEITSTRRTKEIGIRKVMGATTRAIASLVSREFIRLTIVANLLAWPVAWYVMSQWLQNFAYRSELEVWVFAAAGLASLGLTLCSVSVQTLKAALSNPVESLRDE